MAVAAWLLVVITGIIFSITPTPEQDVVILMADPDGKVGQVEVATSGGRQSLAEANQMTTVTDKAAPPSAATKADNAYIQKHFAESLAAQPLPPLKFLLYFISGSDELDDKSKALIPDILAAIRERNSFDIGIHGHSDTVGSTEQNIELSMRRANAVKELILQPGLNIQNLEVASHGEGNPLVPTPDGVAEPRNRRVEVVIR